jgi:hypothetical protein
MKDVVFVILTLLFVLCIFIWGAWNGNVAFRQEAVDKGYAQWLVDNKGDVTWEWKECK